MKRRKLISILCVLTLILLCLSGCVVSDDVTDYVSEEGTGNTETGEGADAERGETGEPVNTETEADPVTVTEPVIINSYSTDIINPDGTVTTTIVCYAAPENGNVLYYQEVKAALENTDFDENTLFFVAIDIFKDGNAITVDSEEINDFIELLTEKGYIVDFSEAWTYQGAGEQVPRIFLSGLFTPEQLKNFESLEDYGIAFYFRTNGDSSPVEPNFEISETGEVTLVKVAAVISEEAEEYETAGGPITESIDEEWELVICGAWALDYDNDGRISKADYDIAIEQGLYDKEGFIAAVMESYGLATEVEAEKLIDGEISIMCGVFGTGEPEMCAYPLAPTEE